MKRSIILGCRILVLGMSVALCHGGSLTREASKNLPHSQSTIAPNIVTVEEEKMFVPFQGERFSVFDWNLCKLMLNKYSGNLLISPISVKLALVLLYEGAQDNTARELANVMHLPVGRWDNRDKFKLILQSLRPTFNEYKLDIGSRIYVDSRVHTTQKYAANVKTYYGADILPADFSNPQATVESMNDWVKNVTHNNIEKIIQDGDSIKDSVMVIMNALYFKGSWYKNCFSPEDTTTEPFFETLNKTINIPFMNTMRNFNYAESLEFDAKILRIPYVGNKFAMYFILPRTVEGIEQLAQKITSVDLTRNVWLMQELPVDVKIPKFKFDFTSHLESALRELGIRDIFDNSATLTEIAHAKRTSKSLVVSDIVQKAGIEVNEKGTTAYAVTEIQIGNKMSDQEFIADHPFLFYIEDEITGTILYMGRVSNPLEQSGSTDTAITPTFPSRFNEEVDATQPGEPKLLLTNEISCE